MPSESKSKSKSRRSALITQVFFLYLSVAQLSSVNCVDEAVSVVTVGDCHYARPAGFVRVGICISGGPANQPFVSKSVFVAFLHLTPLPTEVPHLCPSMTPLQTDVEERQQSPCQPQGSSVGGGGAPSESPVTPCRVTQAQAELLKIGFEKSSPVTLTASPKKYIYYLI